MEANSDGQRNVRDNRTDGQTGTRKLVWSPVDERDGGESCQLDENQVQSMDVTLDQKATTTTSTNNVQRNIGYLRKCDGHQAEQSDSMLPIEAMKYSVNMIADVSHQYEHYARKLLDRNKYVVKYFSTIRRGKKSETIEGIHMLMAAIPSELGCKEQTLDKLYACLHTDAEHIL